MVPQDSNYCSIALHLWGDKCWTFEDKSDHKSYRHAEASNFLGLEVGEIVIDCHFQLSILKGI